MATIKVYIRFGEIPQNERSKIYREDEILLRDMKILKELPCYKDYY